MKKETSFNLLFTSIKKQAAKKQTTKEQNNKRAKQQKTKDNIKLTLDYRNISTFAVRKK